MESSVPRSEPSSLNCTPETPTLSAADATRFTVPERVAPFDGEEMETEGAVVSAGAELVKVATGVAAPETVHVLPLVELQPDQLVNVEPFAAVAVRTSDEPIDGEAVQIELEQETPLPDTVPDPEPERETVTLYVVGAEGPPAFCNG